MNDWLIAGNSLTAGILINAGLAKIVAPAGLRAALAELSDRAVGSRSLVPLRFAAAAEAAAGAALLVAGTRVLAALAVACFGLAFAALGGLGMHRGSTLPCGCAGGGNSRRPLGPANVAMGCALAVWALASDVVAVGQHDLPAGYTRYALTWGAIGVLVVCLLGNRLPIRATALSLARGEALS